jgi:nucleoside phosphorylase
MTSENTIIIVPSEREARFFSLHDLHPHICGIGMAECAATTAQLLAGLQTTDALPSPVAGQRPGLVILAGIAGTYTDTLKIGDAVAVASETIADLGRRNADGSFVPLFQKTYHTTAIPKNFRSVHSNTVNMAGGLGSTGDDAGGENASRGNAGSTGSTGNAGNAGSTENAVAAEIENMEGAAFLAVCQRFGVRAMEVRTISNRVGQPVDSESLDLAARRLAAEIEKIIANHK